MHIRHFQSALIVLCGTLLASSSALALSPPWHAVARQLHNTVGQTPGVIVNEPMPQGSKYFIDIMVHNARRAASLRLILKRKYGDNITVVRVFGPDGREVSAPRLCPTVGVLCSPQVELARHFETALAGNRLFVRAFPFRSGLESVVWVETAKEVIQYWNDDLSDFHGNSNEVAMRVFGSVCRPAISQIAIRWTTLDDNTGWQGASP
jgi:hypothetical protein